MEIKSISGAVLAIIKSETLQGADLRWADLRWADLRWADLQGVKGIVSISPIGKSGRIVYAVAHKKQQWLKLR